MPLSGAVAEAVEACCPQLARLALDYDRVSRHEALRGEEASEYDYGCVQVLCLCGPRLRELRLLGVKCWQPLSYMALRRCTALTSLELGADVRRALGESHRLSLLVWEGHGGATGQQTAGLGKRWKAVPPFGIPVPIYGRCVAG